MKTNSKLLVVRTLAQKVLYDSELRGQISDGCWENDWTDTRLWNVYVVVGNTHEDFGISFVPKCEIAFNDPDLLEIVGDRMLEAVQKVVPDYIWADMEADLEDLTDIVFGEAR